MNVGEVSKFNQGETISGREEYSTAASLGALLLIRKVILMEDDVTLLALLAQLLDLLVGLPADVREQLGDVGAILGTDFVEGDPVGFGKLLPRRSLHLTRLLEVGLVGDKEDGDLGAGVFVDLLHPVLDVGEGRGGVDGVGEDDDQCALVEGRRQVLELLLTRRVPDLQLDLILLHLQRLHLEVHTDRRRVRRLETVVAVPQQDVRLAHPAVPDYHCFHHEVAVRLLLRLHSKLYHRQDCDKLQTPPPTHLPH